MRAAGDRANMAQAIACRHFADAGVIAEQDDFVVTGEPQPAFNGIDLDDVLVAGEGLRDGEYGQHGIAGQTVSIEIRGRVISTQRNQE